MAIRVEICAEGLTSALEAGRGGAHRVELCENRAVGGVTPGPGAIAVASERLEIPVHVLIRPRGGNFVYSDDEILAMKRDIQAARALGASGVVLGCLTLDGRIDLERTAWLIGQARGSSVTFHKAFDAARDPFEALDDLIGLGVDRVLTSGGPSTAMEGRAVLGELTRRARGRIVVMAGGSIALGQVRPILEAGVREIHLGSAACSQGGGVDPDRVRRIVEEASMAEIYHITTRDAWDRGVAEGAYRASSLATEGFLHASTTSQVAASANRFFRGVEDLVVLRIDPDRVEAPIDWAMSKHSSDPFPHVVGPLNLEAVRGVVPLVRSPSGEFEWPPAEVP